MIAGNENVRAFLNSELSTRIQEQTRHGIIANGQPGLLVNEARRRRRGQAHTCAPVAFSLCAGNCHLRIQEFALPVEDDAAQAIVVAGQGGIGNGNMACRHAVGAITADINNRTVADIVVSAVGSVPALVAVDQGRSVNRNLQSSRQPRIAARGFQTGTIQYIQFRCINLTFIFNICTERIALHVLDNHAGLIQIHLGAFMIVHTGTRQTVPTFHLERGLLQVQHAIKIDDNLCPGIPFTPDRRRTLNRIHHYIAVLESQHCRNCSFGKINTISVEIKLMALAIDGQCLSTDANTIHRRGILQQLDGIAIGRSRHGLVEGRIFCRPDLRLVLRQRRRHAQRQRQHQTQRQQNLPLHPGFPLYSRPPYPVGLFSAPILRRTSSFLLHLHILQFPISPVNVLREQFYPAIMRDVTICFQQTYISPACEVFCKRSRISAVPPCKTGRNWVQYWMGNPV